MSEQRWAVLGDPDGNGWIVAHPGDVFRLSDGRLECWAVHSRHHTWAEAMQEADRMAHTITVTLPRVTSRHKVTCSTHPAQFSFDADPTSEWGGLVRIGSAYGDISFYSWDDVEAVALALLAHARRQA